MFSRNFPIAGLLIILAISVSLTGCGGGGGEAGTDIISAVEVDDSTAAPTTDVHVASIEEITGQQKLIAKDLRLAEAPIGLDAQEKAVSPATLAFCPKFWVKTRWLKFSPYAGKRFIGPCGTYSVGSRIGAMPAGARAVVLDIYNHPITQQSPKVWGFGTPALYTIRVTAPGMAPQTFTLEIVSASSFERVMRAVPIDLNTNDEWRSKAGYSELTVAGKFVALPVFYNAVSGKRVPAPAGQTSQIYGGIMSNDSITPLGGSSFQAVDLGTSTVTLYSANYSNTNSWFYAQIRVRVVAPQTLFRDVAGKKPRITEVDTQVDLVRSAAGYMMDGAGKKYIFNLDDISQTLDKGGYYGDELYARVEDLISGTVCGYLIGVDEFEPIEGRWYKITWMAGQTNQAECPMETLRIPTPRG